MLDVAIVGAGLMGRWHLATARRLGARVVAVIDPDLHAAARLAARAPGAEAARDLAGIVAGPKVRLAHVCSPVDTHLPVGLALAQARIHALIEKPLAATLPETRRLLEAAALNGVHVCPVHQYAFQSAVAQAARRLPQLGKLRRIEIDVCSAGATGRVAGDRDLVASEILPHPISLIQRLAPGFQVDSPDWRVLSADHGELFATAVQDGLTAAISISMGSRPTQFVIRLLCDGGTIEIDAFHGYAVTLAGEVSRRSKVLLPFERAAKGATAAGANLLGRAFHGEPAYPGLLNLTREVYAAVLAGDKAEWPLPAQITLAAAAARDILAAELFRSRPGAATGA